MIPRVAIALALALLIACPSASRATEISLLTEAIFHRLSATRTFDLNADSTVSAPDLTARITAGEPGSAGCGAELAPDGTLQIQVDGVAREYVLRLPAAYDGVTPRPVVFGFHGFGGNSAYIEGVTELAENWPEAIGVYPQGLPRTISIFGNIMAPGWQLAAGELEDRDLALFDALLDNVLASYCVNPNRVYVTGHSNGAFFTHVLACNRGDRIAAAAPRAGGVIGCTPGTQVAMILSHGTSDPIVPFASGETSRATWIRRDECTEDMAPYGDRCQINPDCVDDRQVAFCPFEGGHEPSPAFPPDLFRFFKEHAL